MIRLTALERSKAPTMQMNAGPIRVDMLEVSGLRVPYRQVGPAYAREAIVFLHGNPGSSEDWVDLLGNVQGIARAVALDLPGYGQADKPDSFPYTIPSYARFLDQALGTLGITQVHFVVHDIGGPVALAWATRRMEALRSLTMINIGLQFDYQWHTTAKLWRTPCVGDLLMAVTTKAGFSYAIQKSMPRKLPQPFIDRMFREYDKQTRKTTLKLYRSIDDPAAEAERLAPRLREFRGPVLVVWGARDPFAGTEMATKQREVFPQARIEILPDSGHWSFIDDPERVAELVVPFLRAAVAEGAAG
jgi:pimeloyl-ACP methyl ester carboxylesterase